MKQKMYAHGKHKFKAYFMVAGHGYEVGLKQGAKKTLFMSNFVHKEEAFEWYQMMCKEIESFCKKYWVSSDCSYQWYCKFVSNHLYKMYYTFVDKKLVSHCKTYQREFGKDFKKYKTLARHWHKEAQVPFRKCA